MTTETIQGRKLLRYISMYVSHSVFCLKKISTYNHFQMRLFSQEGQKRNWYPIWNSNLKRTLIYALVNCKGKVVRHKRMGVAQKRRPDWYTKMLIQSKYKCTIQKLSRLLKGWFPKFANMIHSMLRQDLSKITTFLKISIHNNVSKNLKNVISLIFYLDPAWACCVAYSQTLGISLYMYIRAVRS